jgi:hypothetical protein
MSDFEAEKAAFFERQRIQRRKDRMEFWITMGTGIPLLILNAAVGGVWTWLLFAWIIIVWYRIIRDWVRARREIEAARKRYWEGRS